ncbi:hypothetical protein NIES208_15565 [[Limnothrix rosea] IAM M-220]|nr:hypothetical protein NIES208_15565 [[Limnothrix rosea] IAM M-220]
MSEAFKDFLNYFGSDQECYLWALKDGAIAGDLETELASITEEEQVDLQQRSQRFFESLDSLLGSQREVVSTTLLERLGGLLPRQQCLDILKICQEKRDLVTDYREQLSLAIADLLPQWHHEDRTILMRSYAGAFRGGSTANDSLPGSDKNWDVMSPLEQAQRLVAIADFVLTELHTLDNENR